MIELLECDDCGWRGTEKDCLIEGDVTLYYVCPKCGGTRLNPPDLIGVK